jgi:hypothetical protein
MRFVYGGALAALLLSSLATSASAQCTNAKCTDAAAIEQARSIIQSTCGCTRAGQTHGTYQKCVKKTLKAANLTALIPSKPCRKLIMKCESKSICGRTTSSVCCTLKKNGTLKKSIVKSADKCKGSACGAVLGLYSTFDACAADATCAGPTTTTTTPGSTTTTTTQPSGGSVLKGALAPPTLGRFNYNLKIGIPAVNDACLTQFPGMNLHPCTHAELQSADTAGDLVGLTDTASTPVTSFWAIDNAQPPLQQCQDDNMGGSLQNWEYGTAHTASRGQKVPLNTTGPNAGHLGSLQSSQQCALLGTASWVGCCQ